MCSTTFDESSENHVYWAESEGWIASQTQVITIPETQAAGATVVVKIAIVDNNKDGRPVILTVRHPAQRRSSSTTRCPTPRTH